MSASKLNRREFLHVVSVSGAAFVLGCYLPPARAEAGIESPEQSQNGLLNTFIKIQKDGTVELVVPRPDIGQGVRTSLAMILAEELDCDWSKVKVVQAEGDDKYGNQGVGGSGTIMGSFGLLRGAGAAAKAMLLGAAAAKWGVDSANCVASSGVVTCGPNKATYGELAALAAAQPVPDSSSLKLKDKSEYKILGKPTKRVDNADIVRGTGKFASDIRVPNMKHAVIARPPAFGGSVASFDEAAAMKVKGVRKVVKVGSGVGVVADNTWAAMAGKEALNVKFDPGRNAGVNTQSIERDLMSALGDADAPAATVTKKLTATYSVPYLAHAMMEPLNALVDARSDRCEAWVGTQSPQGCRQAIAGALGLDQASVKVNVMLAGGGFGRRGAPDAAVEAALLSREMGCPVQVIWTRDDDIKHDSYRPASVHRITIGIDAQGRPAHWAHTLAVAAGGRRGGGRNTGGAGIPYDIPGATMSQGGVDAPIPTGAWRSVMNTQLVFANESAIDELAHLAGQDPVEFRKSCLRNAKLLNCLSLAAQRAGWGKALPKGEGMGVGLFSGYGSHIAQIVHVRVSPRGEVKVLKVSAVVDCGLAINPLGIQAQVEGATMDGVATALFAAITIDGGGAQQSGFHDFGWAQMADAPEIDVHVIETGNSPGGMGEVGYPASAPAIANAIFAATGKRVRRLPIRAKDLA